MAKYDPNQLGVQAPSGGFQQGGWYSGRQYWNGTLSDPGVIHPESNQQGAGQAVSDEVNRQSSVAQGKAPDAISNYLATQRSNSGNSLTQAFANVPTTRQTQSPGQSSGVTIPEQTINLPEMYDNLFQSSGINEKQDQIKKAEENFLEARNEITNNPFLSASDMDRRLQRIRQAYEREVAPLRSDVESKKADIQMQLDLQTKQFDINSQSAQLALSQFNSLLEMGALNGASDADIANITRSTGLSSGMIQNAIIQQANSNLQTITETFDDGTNEGFIIYSIDPAGNVVNQSKQVTGRSSKTSGGGFSSDPFVSTFVQQLMEMNQSIQSSQDAGISNLWGN